MSEQYEAKSENYEFSRGEKYPGGEESDSVLRGNLGCTIKQVFLKYEGDYLWGGHGEWSDSTDLGKLEDIAKKARVPSPSKFLHEYDDEQLERMTLTPIEVDANEVWLSSDELKELREFEKRLEETIPDYRKPEPLKVD